MLEDDKLTEILVSLSARFKTENSLLDECVGNVFGRYQTNTELTARTRKGWHIVRDCMDRSVPTIPSEL